MNWGNAFVVSAADGRVELKLHLEGDFKKTKKKVFALIPRNIWVNINVCVYAALLLVSLTVCGCRCTGCLALPMTTVCCLNSSSSIISLPRRRSKRFVLGRFDHICICIALILAPISYPQGEDIKDFINPHSRKMSLAIGEPALRNVQHGTIIQLERKGFFRVDKAFVRAGQVHANADRRTQTALPSFQLRCFNDDFVLRRCSSSLFRLAGRHKMAAAIVHCCFFTSQYREIYK